MTATVENPAESGEAAAGTGRVARVIGPVVDVEFAAEHMPEIYYALHVNVVLEDETRTLTLEVEQHIGDNIVRAISMQPTDGLPPPCKSPKRCPSPAAPPRWASSGRRPRSSSPASRSSTCSPRTCWA